MHALVKSKSLFRWLKSLYKYENAIYPAARFVTLIHSGIGIIDPDILGLGGKECDKNGLTGILINRCSS